MFAMLPPDAHKYVKSWACECGFDQCRITVPGPIGHVDYFQRWLLSGRAGEMGYLRKNTDSRANAGALWDGVQSIIVVALSYHQRRPPRPKDGHSRGRVAMYAWGRDYHRVMKKKLHSLADRMRAEWDTDFKSQACVDTAPVTERELAAMAGIGWIGKNTLVLNRELGSLFFLGALVTSLELTSDEPVTDHCGSCTACLDACPTNAFPAPYEMDATRCISYLTIEHRSDIDESLQPLMGDWVFGCDICQEVCPFNGQAAEASEPDFAVRAPAPYPELQDILDWSQDEYADGLRGSAAKRAKLDMWKRNARIAMKNVDGTG